MKRKSRFFIGFIAAALTFGTLFATIGPKRFMRHKHHCHASQCNNDNVNDNTSNRNMIEENKNNKE